MATKELSIKLLIDTKAHKVCFAEAGGDAVEFLSGLLSLPLGTVANLLTKERMAGSICNVLDSVEKLDATYKSKERRLSPAVAPATLSRLQQLLASHLNNGSNNNRDLFTCDNGSSHSYYHGGKLSYLSASTTSGTACPICKNGMYRIMRILGDTGTEVVPMNATYTIKDDLSVTPAQNLLSGITLLAQCGVKDMSALQEKTVKIGKDEALAILVASLKSKTVLTDVFLPKKNARCKREPPEEIIQI